MPRPTHLFSDAQKSAVEDAIFDAEQKTGAEIVVVVAARSGGYRRVADVFALSIAVAVLFVVMWVFGDSSGQWVVPTKTHLHPGLIVGVLVGTFAAMAAIADAAPAIVRTVAGHGKLKRHVRRLGPSYFQQLRVRSTEDGVGVLIYVSLFERMVMIVPDDAAAEMVNAGELESVREKIRAGIRARQIPEALAVAITEAGEILSTKLPAPKKNMDQLPNELHLIDY
jgi:putative membrane protein